MRIKSIRLAGAEPVYNMEVEDTHDFVLGNGMVAHNCYDMARYVMMKTIITPKPVRHDIVKPYDPLAADEQPDHYAFYRRYL